jgi:hypothetical protein
MKSAEKSIEIGSQYFVEWKHGRVEGDIIEKRLIKKYRNQSSDDINSEDFQPSDYEYYVHFLGYDRRLDEWVAYERIDISTSVEQRVKHNCLMIRAADESSIPSLNGQKT